MKLLTLSLVVLLLSGASLVAYFTTRPLNPWHISNRYQHYLVVDKSDFRLYFLEKGVVKRDFPVVIGRPRTQTPVGRWKVSKKIKFDQLGIYGFNKLQLALLEEEKFTPTIYAIHGTNQEYLVKKMPRMFSNGCVRLKNKDMAWLWSRVAVGTRVKTVP